jgi:hypothetical protein
MTATLGAAGNGIVDAMIPIDYNGVIYFIPATQSVPT